MYLSVFLPTTARPAPCHRASCPLPPCVLPPATVRPAPYRRASCPLPPCVLPPAAVRPAPYIFKKIHQIKNIFAICVTF